MDSNELLAAVYERVGEMHSDLKNVLTEHADLKTRVRKLETQWAKLLGMVTVIGLPFTLLYSYLKRKLA